MASINPAPNSKRNLIIAVAATVAGIVLLAFAAVGIGQRYLATHAKAALPDARTTISEDVAKPAETAPVSALDYHVAADQPRSIKLPSVGAEGLIQKVGLNKQGAVVAPTNIAFAGWYASGARPGEPGVALIDGHVQGYYNPGIFKRLSSMKSGDQFSVEFGDHSRRQFKVVSVTSYPVAEVSKHMLSRDPSIDRQLNLITCDGAYDRDNHRYANRVLVVSKAL